MFQNLKLAGKIEYPEIWISFKVNGKTAFVKYNRSTKTVVSDTFSNSTILQNQNNINQFDTEVSQLIMETKLART